MGTELLTKIRRRSLQAEASPGAVVQVARAESPARIGASFRSGWMRPPQVDAPLADGAALSGGLAGGSSWRSSSAPCVRRLAKPPTLTNASAVRSKAEARSGSVPLGATIESTLRSSAASLSNIRALPRDDKAAGCGLVLGSARTRGSAARCSSRPLHRSVAAPATDFVQQPHSEGDASDVASECTDVSDISCLQGNREASSTSSVAVGPRHEGWLAKRTSAKIAARWQHRYFTLQGCMLRYSANPNYPPRRCFDLRKAKSIRAAPGNRREIELDYGFRVWRLSADRPDDARKWLVLLEAARLVAGPDAGGPAPEDCEDLSDTDSTISTATSNGSQTLLDTQATLRSVRVSKENNESKASSVALSSALGITDLLEVNPEKLDESFDVWFSCEGARVDSKFVCHALSEAFLDLWRTLSTSARSQRHTQGALGRLNIAAGPDAALDSLRLLRPDPMALHDAINGVLGEYLLRIKERLERWLDECEPCADDIGEVVSWFLFEGLPAMERFQKGVSKLAASPVVGWHELAIEIERLLLCNWESNQCDEICAQLETMYTLGASTCSKNASSNAIKNPYIVGKGSVAEAECGSPNFPVAQREFSFGPSWADEAQRVFSFGPTYVDDSRPHKMVVQARVNMVREVLHAELTRGTRWQERTLARDRAASILIGALSTVLRCYRESVCDLLIGKKRQGSLEDEATQNHKLGSKRLPQKQRPLKKILSELMRRLFQDLPCGVDANISIHRVEALLGAADEAACLAALCQEANRIVLATSTIYVDVLSAFAVAFEKESLQLCGAIVEAQFATAHRNVLCMISFGSQALKDGSLATDGVLESASRSANAFLEETFAQTSAFCRSSACNQILQLLVSKWSHAFIQAAPKMTSYGAREVVSKAITVDMRLLGQMAHAWGTDCDEIVLPLREVGSLLSASGSVSPSTMGDAELKFVRAIGSKQGTRLATAAARVATRTQTVRATE